MNEGDDMAKYQVTGVSTPFGGLTWDRIPGDAEYAQQVISFLEGRRLLFGLRHAGDEQHCFESAKIIRDFLDDRLATHVLGKGLLGSLKEMRSACLRFIEAGGTDASNFMHRESVGVDPFSLALGELRTRVGLQVALLSSQFDIDVHNDLKQSLPPVDE
jgi:hypothetical protein